MFETHSPLSLNVLKGIFYAQLSMFKMFFGPHWYWTHSLDELYLRWIPARHTTSSRVACIQHCLLASKQHRYLNRFQQHQEFTSVIPFKYCLDPKGLNFSAWMGSSVSNMARPVSTKIIRINWSKVRQPVFVPRLEKLTSNSISDLNQRCNDFKTKCFDPKCCFSPFQIKAASGLNVETNCAH